MRKSWNRRDVLGSGGAAAAAALAGPISLPGGLERTLPAAVRSLLPGEAGQAAELIGELLRLEEEAKVLRLPASPLAFGSGQIPVDPARLYEQLMPRLVAVIDRSQAAAPGLSDKAGAVLAKLHQTQYVVPQAWLGPLRTGAAPTLDLPGTARPSGIAQFDDDPPIEPPAMPLPDLTVPGGDLPEVQGPLPPINPSHAFDRIADEYRSWFDAAEIRPQHQESANWHLAMMRQSRPRYEGVGRQVSVPWQFVAAIHGLEASFNFRAHLHNGDFPLTARTRQVPAGRPLTWLPPSSWEASALDALRMMGFAGQSDWSLPRMLYRIEAYNGFGYRHAKRATPYLWSFSNLYDRGKFVADGRFDPNARSQQCGAAVMLKVLDLAGELD